MALRRYLMLRECGYDVPADIAAYCEPLVCRMADSELGRARVHPLCGATRLIDRLICYRCIFNFFASKKTL